MKRFKKRRKLHLFKYLFIIIAIYLIFQFISCFILQIKLVDSNEEFILKMLENSTYSSNYEKSNNNIFSNLVKQILKISLNKPQTLLESSFSYKSNQNTNKLVYSENNTTFVMNEIDNYIEEKEPLVYIYSSHQSEKYSSVGLEEYNITPDVKMASFLLKEKLNKLGIETIMEDSDILEFMRINNYDYVDSYKASRFFIEDVMTKNDSIKLYIDFHRDALSKKASTVTIDGKEYAKVLFVVGAAYSDYQDNLNLANTLNNMIKAKYPTLTRGVISKKGSGVNGIYNQDLSKNMMLLEVGAQYNTIEEVTNTLDALAPIIKEYLNDRN